jgi:hypothetical protein
LDAAGRGTDGGITVGGFAAGGAAGACAGAGFFSGVAFAATAGCSFFAGAGAGFGLCAAGFGPPALEWTTAPGAARVLSVEIGRPHLGQFGN